MNGLRLYDFRKKVPPHPGPLPQEKESRRPILHTLPISVAVGATGCFISEAVRSPNAFRSATRGRTIHPLLGGEGRGEGERSSHFPFSSWCEYLSRMNAGQVHFAKSILLAPDFPGLGSSTVRPSAMPIRRRGSIRTPNPSQRRIPLRSRDGWFSDRHGDFPR
jgi:hypothetical protein